MFLQLVKESHNSFHYFEEIIKNNLCDSTCFLYQINNITNTMKFN